MTKYPVAGLAVIILTLVASGCGNRGVITISNRLRLTETRLVIPRTNSLHFVVSTGKWRTVMTPSRIAIRRGSITFRGITGYIRLTTNETTIIWTTNLHHEIAVRMSPGCQNIEFHMDRRPFSMGINWLNYPYPSLEDYCKSNNCRSEWFYPELSSSRQNSQWDVVIPCEMTSDFDGEVDDWRIWSNWD